MPDEDRSLDDFSNLVGLRADTPASETVQIDGLNLGVLADGSIADTSEPSVLNTSFEFCITSNGRPVGTAKFAAPSVEAVIQLVEMIVAAANASERARGMPGLWGATLGACPA